MELRAGLPQKSAAPRAAIFYYDIVPKRRRQTGGLTIRIET
jgi:hypothetical protein